MKQPRKHFAATAAHLGHQAWATVMVAILSFSLVTGGCKKATTGGGETAKLLQGAAASQIAPDVLAIADALTDKTQVFGFLDLGQPLPELAVAMGMEQAMVDDLLTLLQTRTGLQLRNARVVGLAKFDAKEPVFFFPNAVGNDSKSDLGFSQKYAGADVQIIGDVYATKIGTTLVLGEEAPVKGYLDDRAAKRPSLSKSNPAWVKHALTQAADGMFMISLSGDLARSEPNTGEGQADVAARAIVAQLDAYTMVVGASGALVELQAKPGQGAAMGADVAKLLAMGRAEMIKAIAEAAEKGGEAAFGASLLQAYGTHFFDSVEQTVTGDAVALRLAFRMPPPFELGAAPELSQRLSPTGDWMIAQLNAGGPLLPTVLKYTDFIGKPMDLTAVAKDIQAFAIRQLGVDVTQTQAVTVAVSGEVPTFSLVNAAGTQAGAGALAPGQTKELGEMVAAAMPWGTVIFPSKHSAAVMAAMPGRKVESRLLSHALLATKADDPTIMVAAADLSLAPPELLAEIGDKIPVKAAYARLSLKSIEVELQAMPGKAAAIKAMIGLGLGAAQDQARKLYEQRNSLPLEQAIGGVIAHHQVQTIVKYFTPKDLGDDRLGFSIPMPAGGANGGAMKMQIGVAVVGILAAVAIPAFMKYMQRAKAAQEMYQATAPTP